MLRSIIVLVVAPARRWHRRPCLPSLRSLLSALCEPTAGAAAWRASGGEPAAGSSDAAGGAGETNRETAAEVGSDADGMLPVGPSAVEMLLDEACAVQKKGDEGGSGLQQIRVLSVRKLAELLARWSSWVTCSLRRAGATVGRRGVR